MDLYRFAALIDLWQEFPPLFTLGAALGGMRGAGDRPSLPTATPDAVAAGWTPPRGNILPDFALSGLVPGIAPVRIPKSKLDKFLADAEATTERVLRRAGKVGH